MNAVSSPPMITPRKAVNSIRCYYRPAVLFAAGLLLIGTFWFASRYPQLLSKSQHLGDAMLGNVSPKCSDLLSNWG